MHPLLNTTSNRFLQTNCPPLKISAHFSRIIFIIDDLSLGGSACQPFNFNISPLIVRVEAEPFVLSFERDTLCSYTMSKSKIPIS